MEWPHALLLTFVLILLKCNIIRHKYWLMFIDLINSKHYIWFPDVEGTHDLLMIARRSNHWQTLAIVKKTVWLMYHMIIFYKKWHIFGTVACLLLTAICCPQWHTEWRVEWHLRIFISLTWKEFYSYPSVLKYIRRKWAGFAHWHRIAAP